MSEINLNIIVSIIEIVMFIIFLILAVFIFKAAKSFLLSVSNIEKEIRKISDEIDPVIKDIEYIAGEARIITDKTVIHFERAEVISDVIIEKVSGYVNFLNTIEKIGKGYFKKAALLTKAIGAGIKTFQKN